MTPELIIFDCDGVLIDSEVIACSTDAEELTGLGYPITVEEVIRRFSGVPSNQMMREIERETGRPLPEDLPRRIEARILERFRAELQPIPNVPEILEKLRPPYCVASSSSPNKLALGLIETGLFDKFYPNIFSTVLVENGKPAPDIFLYAADRMGVQAGRCVVVEDSVAGITAAKAAGMKALGFTGGAHCSEVHAEHLRNAGADLIFDDFSQLLKLVAALAQGAIPARRSA